MKSERVTSFGMNAPVETPGEITQLLWRIENGDAEARENLIAVVYRQLHRIARFYLRGEGRAQTIQATALIHEVYIYLFGNAPIHWNDRKSFYGMAAQAMRRILVEHARGKFKLRAKKHGPISWVSLAETVALASTESAQMIVLDEALTSLGRQEPRQVQIVELRFFAGLDEKEIARILGISERTVQREWRVARAWLYREVSDSTKQQPRCRQKK
jgi:RNA polymerase sigma-70 factor, ECF subfamily